MPVGDRRRAEQHRRGERRADEERHHATPGRCGEHYRQGEQHQGLNADRRAGQPAREAEPPPALREDRVKQQPDGHRVLRMAPAGGDRPQDAGAGGGEQAALPEPHAKLLRQRVGGEERDAAQRDLVRPGQQPYRRVQVMRARDGERQPERRDHGGAGQQDDRRAWQRDQPGGRRVEAADVPVREPGRRDQRSPQVVGERPFRPADQRRAPGGGVHPDHDEAHRCDKRKYPPPDSLPHPVPWPLYLLAIRRPALRRRSRIRPCLVNRVLDYKAQPVRSSPHRLTTRQVAKPVPPRSAGPLRRCPATVMSPLIPGPKPGRLRRV